MTDGLLFCMPLLIQVLYKENLGTGTPIPITPEMERVKQNQENLSSVFWKEAGGQGDAT